ncbi:MAG TPA: HNH endonuclease [Geothrix sp.]|nr:HNH endonuclease [Geothrix sp.]
MRCIFCKKDSQTSKSVEHVIPESLGNSTLILAPGVVCDKCNQYFAVKVEKQLLGESLMESLRSSHFIESKKGKIPTGKGFIDGHEVLIQPTTSGKLKANILVPTKVFQSIKHNNSNNVVVSTGGLPGESPITSRFIAKIALETLAFRTIENGFTTDWLVDDIQFDPIRNHAKLGQPKVWNISRRRLYAPRLENAAGKSYNIIYHYNILQTNANELYFIICLFGVEYSINYGGPSMDGYFNWLKEHNDMSPLYSDGNERPTLE